MKPRHRQKPSLLKILLLGAGSGTAFSAALLLLFSLWVTKKDVDQKTYPIFVYAAAILGAFLCGAVAAGKSKWKTWQTGLAAGGAFCVVFLGVCFVLSAFSVSVHSVYLALTILASAMAGSVLVKFRK